MRRVDRRPHSRCDLDLDLHAERRGDAGRHAPDPVVDRRAHLRPERARRAPQRHRRAGSGWRPCLLRGRRSTRRPCPAGRRAAPRSTAAPPAGGRPRASGRASDAACAAWPASPVRWIVTRAPPAITGPVVHATVPASSAGPVVVAEDTFHREPGRTSRPPSSTRAAVPFLRRLEHELHGAGPARRRASSRPRRRAGRRCGRHGRRRASRPGCRGVGQPGLLRDRQRVHVAAQPHAAVGRAARQGRHHAVPADPRT